MSPAKTPEGYLAAQRAFERAWQAGPAGSSVRRYRFAGHDAQFRVAGDALAEHLHRPFAHLAVESAAGAPCLAADVWEAGLADYPSAEPAAADEPDQLWGYGLGTFATYGGGRYVHVRLPHGATWLDRAEGSLVAWRAPALPVGERTKPLQQALYVWYHDHDVQVVHAGLIARAGQGVLVGGRAGSGKSTTTLVCALNGFQFLSDDHVGLQAADGAWVGHSIYCCVRIEPDHLQNFPAAIPGAVPGELPNDPKSLLLLAEIWPERVIPSAQVRAIVLPRLNSGRQPGLRPASRLEALRVIGPSSLIVPLGAGAAGLRRLTQLAAAVPAFWLDVGPQMQDVPRWIDAALERALA